MSMMNICGPVFCPNCVNNALECSDANYSGTGTDMANCPKCGRGFCVSYKIDKVTPCPALDVDLEATP